jgi:hypothetical protein
VTKVERDQHEHGGAMPRWRGATCAWEGKVRSRAVVLRSGILSKKKKKSNGVGLRVMRREKCSSGTCRTEMADMAETD